MVLKTELSDSMESADLYRSTTISPKYTNFYHLAYADSLHGYKKNTSKKSARYQKQISKSGSIKMEHDENVVFGVSKML